MGENVKVENSRAANAHCANARLLGQKRKCSERLGCRPVCQKRCRLMARLGNATLETVVMCLGRSITVGAVTSASMTVKSMCWSSRRST
jgi:hypothetical protein